MDVILWISGGYYGRNGIDAPIIVGMGEWGHSVIGLIARFFMPFTSYGFQDDSAESIA